MTYKKMCPAAPHSAQPDAVPVLCIVNIMWTLIRAQFLLRIIKLMKTEETISFPEQCALTCASSRGRCEEHQVAHADKQEEQHVYQADEDSRGKCLASTVHGHVQAADRGVKRIRVHTLTDGRDCEDGTSIKLMETLQKDLQALEKQGVDARVASGGGRMCTTMDRYEVTHHITALHAPTECAHIGFNLSI